MLRLCIAKQLCIRLSKRQFGSLLLQQQYVLAGLRKHTRTHAHIWVSDTRLALNSEGVHVEQQALQGDTVLICYSDSLSSSSLSLLSLSLFISFKFCCLLFEATLSLFVSSSQPDGRSAWW